MDIIYPLPKIVRIRLIQLLIDNESELWSKHQIKMLDQFMDKNETGKIHILHNGFRLLHDRDNLIIHKGSYEDKVDSVELYPNIPVFYKNYKYELTVQAPNTDYINNSESVDWSKLKNKSLSFEYGKKGTHFNPWECRDTKK